MNKAVVIDEHRLRILRKYFESLPSIKFAAIIGSTAIRGYSYHDIDIAIKIEN